ncbi:hypothetical protein NE237_023282 [Protea cynaroides]|uniref:Choline transporter-like protein n=1 Tax=Protea cynaroides TaxID=273540 RepID=A0A9Q0HBX6_9MAGN|nr:hypothetical protein NE237_023282 [Protea cynaroides]
MGSTDEPNKTSHGYDSSSPSTPLLSKSFPSPSREEDQNESNEEQNHYLQITFNYGPRRFQDLPFMVLFILFCLSTFAFGIFSVFHRNPNSSNVSSFAYDSNTTSCVKQSLSAPPLDYSIQFFICDFFSNYASSSHLLRNLIWTLVITLILSVPFVLGLLWLLRHYTKQIVYVSLPFFLIIPIFFNVYWFVACTVSSNCRDAFPLPYRILLLVFLFLIIGVIVWIIVTNWHRIELTVRIIGIASEALARNLGLFGVLPCLTLGLLIYFVPIVVFLVFARLNGKIVPRVSKGSDEGYSCVWKQDSWVPAYYTLAILTMLWSAAVMVETKAYVTSGTIAQWYFSKDNSPPRRSLRNSLRNAFGPSFGTICFSGSLICVVRVVRAAVDSAKREDIPGIVNVILRCCVNALLSAVDFLNKFMINFAAITGEGYCSSAKMTYELLRRNLLSAVIVETVSTRILAGIIFVLSAIYAIVVWAILNAASNLGVDAYLVSVLAWALLIVVLGFFVHMLDNVIDTIYGSTDCIGLFLPSWAAIPSITGDPKKSGA